MAYRSLSSFVVCLAVGALLSAAGRAQSIEISKLRGIVIDDVDAQLEGTWKPSTSARPFIGEGYRHDENNEKGAKFARFVTRVPADGQYRVLFGFTASGNRASNVPVTIQTADGVKKVQLNQRQTPRLNGFEDLGQFQFRTGRDIVVEVSNEGTDGHVIIDAVQIVTSAEFKLVQREAKTKVVKVAQKKKAAAKPKKAAPPAEPPPVFQREKTSDKEQLTTSQLDAMLAQHVGQVSDSNIIDDELFLRRVSLDIAGRQPTVEELETFLADTSTSKRQQAIDRLLGSEDYGINWANYWSDVIGYRQQEPELTFHDYRPFKKWLAGKLNSEQKWDEVVFDILTARGKVGDNPAGTFIAFHQANPNRLAGETSRVFLGVKIHCAECHDHPFADMPMQTFHGMAAFFVRTEAKIPWNDSSQIELKSKPKGEHKIPGQKQSSRPVALSGIEGSAQYDLGIPDLQRRAVLAQWMVHPKNPFFARAYVNRIWARLMGRGFYEPVDDLGETADDPVFPKLHQALADHFMGSQFDHRSLVRLIVNSRAYQRPIQPVTSDSRPLAAAKTKQLRGDEVFDSLVTAIRLPNLKPQKAKATGDIRFPIPPKTTRDLVNEAFGYDPSFRDELLVRSMKQAMFMMNNKQIQKQINASPDSGTYLAQLLASQPDDQQVLLRLYYAVLARSPKDKELQILQAHLKRVDDRGAAFEDVLWSLINSAEFTTRR